MKKLILSIAIITSLIIAASCKKDKDKNNSSLLINKWELVNTSYREVENGVEVYTDNYTGVAGDYVDFRSDNKVYSHSDGFDDVANFKILNNNKVVIDEDTLEIQSLSSASVRLYRKWFEDVNSFEEITVNLKR